MEYKTKRWRKRPGLRRSPSSLIALFANQETRTNARTTLLSLIARTWMRRKRPLPLLPSSHLCTSNCLYEQTNTEYDVQAESQVESAFVCVYISRVRELTSVITTEGASTKRDALHSFRNDA